MNIINLSPPLKYSTGKMVVVIDKDALYEKPGTHIFGLFKKYIYSESDKNEPVEVVLWNPELKREEKYDLSQYQVTSVAHLMILFKSYASKYFNLKHYINKI